MQELPKNVSPRQIRCKSEIKSQLIKKQTGTGPQHSSGKEKQDIYHWDDQVEVFLKYNIQKMSKVQLV